MKTYLCLGLIILSTSSLAQAMNDNCQISLTESTLKSLGQKRFQRAQEVIGASGYHFEIVGEEELSKSENVLSVYSGKAQVQEQPNNFLAEMVISIEEATTSIFDIGLRIGTNYRDSFRKEGMLTLSGATKTKEVVNLLKKIPECRN